MERGEGREGENVPVVILLVHFFSNEVFDWSNMLSGVIESTGGTTGSYRGVLAVG